LRFPGALCSRSTETESRAGFRLDRSYLSCGLDHWWRRRSDRRDKHWCLRNRRRRRCLVRWRWRSYRRSEWSFLQNRSMDFRYGFWPAGKSCVNLFGPVLFSVRADSGWSRFLLLSQLRSFGFADRQAVSFRSKAPTPRCALFRRRFPQRRLHANLFGRQAGFPILLERSWHASCRSPPVLLRLLALLSALPQSRSGVAAVAGESAKTASSSGGGESSKLPNASVFEPWSILNGAGRGAGPEAVTKSSSGTGAAAISATGGGTTFDGFAGIGGGGVRAAADVRSQRHAGSREC